MQKYIQVITTGPRADMDSIARELVEERLAACVQVAGPVHSTYRWKGKIEEAQEFMAIVKTSQELYPRVEEAIRRLHSYEVPEILAVPVTAGNPGYLAWLDAELSKHHD